MSSASNVENKHLSFYKKHLRIIQILLVFLIVISIWFFIKNQNNQKAQQEADSARLTKYIQYTNTLLSNLNLTNTAINQIGARVATLDKQSYTSLIPITLSTSETFRGKDHLVSGKYLNELDFFKTLSPQAQHEYIHMTRDQKKIKYGNKLNLT